VQTVTLPARPKRQGGQLPIQNRANAAGSELSRQVPVDLEPDTDLNEGRGCPGHGSSSLAFLDEQVKSEQAAAQAPRERRVPTNSENRYNSRQHPWNVANMREDMMQSRLWISAVLLVLSISVQPAAAGPQEDVAAAGQKWATVFADNNPDTMLPLYAKDAVPWGTLSPTVRSDPAALKAYFVGAFQALPKATVKFGDQLIRVYGNTAVNTGYYTFSYTKDGETKSIPARYSFTYVKDGNDWKIVDHHSSAVPAPPK
jgi:uncharacterized protein (TIGR02246 family)